MEPGLYLYCVALGNAIPPSDPPAEEDLELKGIGGERVFVIPNHGLWAVAQVCDPALVSEDPKQLSEWVMTHQAVVDCAWERFETVVPFGFGTVIVPKEGKDARGHLADWLAKEAQDLRVKLARMKGKAEYGIQISWDPSVVAPRVTRHDQAIRHLEAEIQAKGSGTAYLLTQKLDGLLRQRLEQAADAYFKECYQQIRGCVEAIQVEKIRKEEPPWQMLANLSCLLPKGDMARLGETLEKISAMDGFMVRFTGPWPPYSFVNT